MNIETMAQTYLEDAAFSEKRGARQEEVSYSGEESPRSVELSLKIVLRLLGVEYPREHDVSDVLNKPIQSKDLPEWFRSELETISMISKRLTEEMGPAFYGDERHSSPRDDFT